MKKWKILAIVIPIALISFMIVSMSIVSYNSDLKSEKLQEKISSSPKCFIDSDCPSEAPICLPQKYSISDMVFSEYICFSEEEGNEVRDEKFQSCLESQEKIYLDALEKDGKIFDIKDPPSPHKANFVGGIVFFLPYMMNNLDFDTVQVLRDEYQLEIIRKGGDDSVIIIALPEGKELETLCTLKSDNRIRETHSYIEWEAVLKENNSPENNTLETLKPLQECSRVPGEEIACPADFVCYEELSGGLGPPGTIIPIESIGGDKLCHKECVTDNDCPLNAPNCLRTERTTEDYTEGFYLCFSEDG